MGFIGKHTKYFSPSYNDCYNQSNSIKFIYKDKTKNENAMYSNFATMFDYLTSIFVIPENNLS
jgi:hypothetical protein